MKLTDNSKLQIYSFFNMNYNFKFISNLSKSERQLALRIKDITPDNNQNFRMYLSDIPNISDGLSYIHEFSNQITFVLKADQLKQYQAYYDFFLQTMPKSIGQYVKINYEMEQKDEQNFFQLNAVSLWQQKYQITNCFDKVIILKTDTIGFKTIQKNIENFRVLIFQSSYLGGEQLFEKQKSYKDFLKLGNTQECDKIRSEFLEDDLSKIQTNEIKYLKINNSIILDSKMFQSFANVEKLSILNSTLNSFTYEAISKYDKIKELKIINYFLPNTNKLPTKQVHENMQNFYIPDIKPFKNLQKLSFFNYLYKKHDTKQVLEENYHDKFDLTLYNYEDISLSDICDQYFFRPNFNVKFVARSLILIDLNKFPNINMTEFKRNVNLKSNLQLVQEMFQQQSIFIKELPYSDVKFSKKCMFQVRITKQDIVYCEDSISLEQKIDLFLADYFNKEVKLILYKKVQ